MSHAHPTGPTPSSSSKFQLIINNALDKYKKRTRNDLLAHPLAAQLQSCDSPCAILAVLQQQIQGLDQSLSSDERWSRWLNPTINVLYALSAAVGAGVSLVCLRGCLRSELSYSSGRDSHLRVSYLPGSASSFQCVPCLIISRGHFVTRYAYISQAAEDTRASQDALIDTFGRIEMFLRRLEIYTEVPLTMEMTDIIIQTMVEVLSILGIATKEIKQRRIGKYLPYKYVNVD
jgi:hypothetical protein